MKKFILLILALSLFSCRPDNVEKAYTSYFVEGINIKVYTIDSCEYIGYNSGARGLIFLSHKGNCKYCRQRNNKH